MRGEKHRVCAVVPAAGRGSRLGGDGPKILTPLGGGQSILTVLCRKLLAVADHINLIVSPEGRRAISETIEREGVAHRTTFAVQPAPIGMGDAIFCGYPVWSRARTILIVWGDQVFVSSETLGRACALQAGDNATFVIPIVALAQPYVEYLFDGADRLIAVKQSREGDICAPGGYGDLGTFVLSVAELRDRWREYLGSAGVGDATGEINFLPFLRFLSEHQWRVRRFTVADEREARGVNTPEDLAFFQSIFCNQATLGGAAAR